MNFRRFAPLLILVAASIEGVLLASSFLPAVSAQVGPPARPMLITGNAILNSSPAPDGLTLVGKVGDQVRGTTTVSSGQYQLVVNGTNGEIINFYLNNIVSSQTVTFDNISNGGVLQLDLSFTGTVVTTSSTVTSSSSTTSTEIPEFQNSPLLALTILTVAALITMRKRRG